MEKPGPLSTSISCILQKQVGHFNDLFHIYTWLSWIRDLSSSVLPLKMIYKQQIQQARKASESTA